MNKKELIEAVAEKAGMPRAQAGRALDVAFEAIAEALKNEEKVQLLGFGTFEVRIRSERQGRNPHTGETMTIPASRSVGFKAGSALRGKLEK